MCFICHPLKMYALLFICIFTLHYASSFPNAQSNAEDSELSHQLSLSEDSSTSNRQCPAKEHFDECGVAEICQKTCLNYEQDIPCVETCVGKCMCDEGLVRKSSPSGRCIPPEQCPQHYVYSGPRVPGCPDEEACNAECVRLGRRYGSCSGPHNRVCKCF